MTKSEMNQAWAELEGWVKGEFCLPISKTSKMKAKYSWINQKGKGANSIPDFTEPNRFFPEVVPRMREIDPDGRFSFYESSVGGGKSRKRWNALYGYKGAIDEKVHRGRSDDIGEAGLQAAIKARKKLGV